MEVAMIMEHSQSRHSYVEFDSEDYYPDEYDLGYHPYDDGTSCAICGTGYASTPFKGTLICESCLESVKRYCY